MEITLELLENTLQMLLITGEMVRSLEQLGLDNCSIPEDELVVKYLNLLLTCQHITTPGSYMEITLELLENTLQMLLVTGEMVRSLETIRP